MQGNKTQKEYFESVDATRRKKHHEHLEYQIKHSKMDHMKKSWKKSLEILEQVMNEKEELKEFQPEEFNMKCLNCMGDKNG